MEEQEVMNTYAGCSSEITTLWPTVCLLPWAGIVIAYYLLYLPANAGAQYYFGGENGLLSAILGSYKAYILQVFFDIIFTSLVFIALPARYLNRCGTSRRSRWIRVET